MQRPYRDVRDHFTPQGRSVAKILARHVLRALPARGAVRAIPALRWAHGFEISARAVERVRDHLGAGGDLLVFSLGRDSSTWELVNRRGRTVFLEDLPEWIAFSRRESPSRELYAMTYTTEVTGSLGYVSAAQIPISSLPAEVRSHPWDVVVVDGPKGFAPGQPGRATSIALAARLVRAGGLVLIDDYDRPLERHISQLVFGRPPDEIIDARRPVGLYQA